MFGLLNESERAASLDPSDYASRRGRFYLIWNASKISGRPMLVALMAGNAAHAAEWTDTATLLSELTDRLRGIFTSVKVPTPLEVIVTRWRKDPFTRGTYSYVGPETRPGDYDLMARSVGNLHFAGEATCGTHPATVHGAFLSGLRAASEVIDDMAGLISIPDPLIGPAPVKQETIPLWAPAVAPMPNAQATPPLTSQPLFKQEDDGSPLTTIAASSEKAPLFPRKPSGPPPKSVCAADPSFWVAPTYGDDFDLDYETGIMATTLGQIGERPVKPPRPGVNPFLLFTKEKWEECKGTVGSNGRDAIRQTIGKWWKGLSEEQRQPYLVQSQSAQEAADALRREWEGKVAQWDRDAARIRREYVEMHPPPAPSSMSSKMGSGAGRMESIGVSKRKTNVSNNVVLDHT
jgi:lysine-specific histone demethylase 1